MSLADSFLDEILSNQKETVKNLPENERLSYLEGIAENVLQNPVLNQQNQPINPETQSAYEAVKSDFNRRKQRAMIETGWTEDQLFERGDDGKFQIDTRLERDIELESQGVVTNVDLPTGDWKLGFGVNQVDDIRRALTKHYGKQVNVIKDGDDVLYYDPEMKKVVKVNLTSAAELGQGLPMAGDVLGTVAMGNLSPQGSVAKQVLGEAAGSALGTGLGEFSRLAIGKAMGVHDMEWDDMAAQSAKEGGISGALTGSVGGMVSAFKGAVNFIKGGQFTVDEATRYGLKTEDANEIIGGINNILKENGSDKKLKATLAQKTGDIELGSIESELVTSKEYAGKFKARADEDKAALREALDVITDPKDTAFTGGQTVSDVAGARLSKGLGRAKNVVSTNINELNKQLNDIGKIWKSEVGAPTAEYLQLKKDASKQSVDQVWENVRKVGGFDPAKKEYNINIPQGDATKALRNKYKERAVQAQTNIEAGGINSIFVGKRSIGARQDLANLNSEISTLKKQWSDASKGKNINANHVRELGEVVDAFVKDRNTALVGMGKENLISAIEAAEQASLKYHETYTRSVVGDLLEKTPSGTSVIKSKKFVDNMMGRNLEEIQDFKNVISDDMEITQQWKEGIADAWKEASFNEKGRYSADASKKWIKNNLDVLKVFFDKKEISALVKTGKLAEKVYGTKVTSGGIAKGNMVSRLQQFKNRINSKWGSGALAKADKAGLTKFITGKGGSWSKPSGEGVETRISKIKAVKNMTSDNPAAWKALQNDFKSNIREDILDVSTGLINPSKISKWVDSAENAEVVKEMMGSKYLSNLKTINEAVKIVNRKGKKLKGGLGQKAIVQGIRAAGASPLSREGRVFTGLLILRSKASHERTANSLLNEKTMSEVAELLKHNKSSRRFIEKAASLGYIVQPDDNEKEE